MIRYSILSISIQSIQLLYINNIKFNIFGIKITFSSFSSKKKNNFTIYNVYTSSIRYLASLE